jgi:hypothetical protein
MALNSVASDEEPDDDAKALLPLALPNPVDDDGSDADRRLLMVRRNNDAADERRCGCGDLARIGEDVTDPYDDGEPANGDEGGDIDADMEFDVTGMAIGVDERTGTDGIDDDKRRSDLIFLSCSCTRRCCSVS